MTVANRHHVTRFEPGELSEPPSYLRRSVGFRRESHLDATVGAIHTSFATCELESGGSINAHVHSFEELSYVLEGNPTLTVDGCTYALEPNDAASRVGSRRRWISTS